MSNAAQVIHPLFIPKGSVRALVTLTLTGAGCYLLTQGTALTNELSVGLFIVLSYYFAHRGAHVGTTSPTEKNPLFLPRGFIRTILSLGLIGTFVYVFAVRKDASLFSSNKATFIPLMSFFAGILLQAFYKRRKARPDVKTPFLDLFDHFKALVVLGAAVGLCLGATQLVAFGFLQGEGFRLGALAAVAFYFGSR